MAPARSKWARKCLKWKGKNKIEKAFWCQKSSYAISSFSLFIVFTSFTLWSSFSFWISNLGGQLLSYHISGSTLPFSPKTWQTKTRWRLLLKLVYSSRYIVPSFNWITFFKKKIRTWNGHWVQVTWTVEIGLFCKTPYSCRLNSILGCKIYLWRQQF